MGHGASSSIILQKLSSTPPPLIDPPQNLSPMMVMNAGMNSCTGMLESLLSMASRSCLSLFKCHRLPRLSCLLFLGLLVMIDHLLVLL